MFLSMWRCTFIFAVGLGTVAAGFASAVENHNDRIVFRESFWHRDYGFSIRIPAGYEALAYPAAYPMHGCSIESADRSWRIVVEASYFDPEAADPLSVELANLDRHFAVLEGERRGQVSRGEIVKLPTVFVSFVFKDPVSGRSWRDDHVLVARRKEEIVYSLSLASENSSWEKAKKVFRSVIRSFRIQKIS